MCRKALFLDIDGVVLYDPDYLSKVKELKFLPHAIAALKKAQEHGFFLVFISNKGGAFAKKDLTDKGLVVLDLAFKKMLHDGKVEIAKIATYYCRHYPKMKDGIKIECSCRKPKAGLFKKAIKDFDIDTRASSVIGDKSSDLTPGIILKCKNAILVKRNQIFYDIPKSEFFDNYVKVPTLIEAVKYILTEDLNI